MAPHRNVPSLTPSIKPLKPERTMRSHEENQERAYIAASRRSDRSLEARVESARRASDIHKKRTGRALRVTEQDVMNEEMYEEEDDDIPWRYRSVTSHLPLEEGLLSRRLQSMLAVQLENQRLLGRAVNSTLQHNPQYQNQEQFISPGMMQMPQNFLHGPMLPPQQLNRTPSSYRHSPYPMQQGQQMRPNYHGRSASLASAQEVSASMQQYSQSAQDTPIQPPADYDRRFSLPQALVPQLPQHHNAPQRSTSYTSLQDSASATPKYQQQASTPTPNDMPQMPLMQPADMSNPFAPLTMNLPLDTQQLLAGSETFPTFDLFGTQQDNLMKPQQPFYSYKPNVSGTSSKTQSNTAGGLDQTLLGGAIDTNLNSTQGYIDTPTSANNSTLNSAVTDPGFDLGFDGSVFNFDPLSAGSGMSSGQITPGNGGYNTEPLFNDFLEQDMFGDVHSL